MVMERWAPFKELWSALQNIVVRKNGSVHHLKALLRRHKPDFLNLLKNPVKNTENRAKVQKAVSEGLILKGESSPQTFSQDFIDEALIISQLFNLNEFSAVELLLEGERQKPHYPHLTRGLVAVLLYWDGRKCLTSSLRTLVQCRRGQTWTLEVSDEMCDLATTLTDELLENGLTKQILKLVSDIQVDKEIETLSKQRGLGGVKHRKQVRDLIAGVRNDLAESLFNFAGQSKLPMRDTMSILDHLEKDTDATSDGKLSTVTLSLLHAVFYAFTLPQDIPVEQDDRGLEVLLKHPLIAEKDFVQTVHKKLMKRDEWKAPGIKASVQLAWALTLRSIAQIPMAVMEIVPDTFNSLGFTEALEQDEIMLEYALAGKAFQFLKEKVIACHEFRTDEFYVRRIHGLITDLIVNMPLKVKEMRNRGDEVARIILLHIMQQEEPPVLREDFKQLMELVTALYGEDENDLQLSVDYWCPASDTFLTGGHQSGSFLGASRLYQRLPQRQVSLFKFLRQSGDLLPPLLYIPYLKMLAALSTGTHSARMAFEMLRANGTNMGVASEGSNVSWDHFFASIHRYYANLKQEQSPYDQSGHFVATLGGTAGQSIGQSAHLHQMSITPQEVEGLRAVLQLLAKITQYDDVACLTVYEHPQWNACSGLLGLLQCPVPAILKGDILLALNELARIPEISVGLLHAMENTRMLGTQTGSGSGSTGRSIEIELEDIEAREEQYHMTCAFLKFICTLTEASKIVSFTASPQSAGFEPYLKFAIELVFLKFMSRSYKRPDEKWKVAGYSLQLFLKLLSQYIPHPEDFIPEKRAIKVGFSSFASQDPLSMSMNSSFGFNTMGVAQQTQSSNKSPGYHLMTHIMNEGNFFKTVMEVVENCIFYLDKYSAGQNLEKMLVNAGLTALQLIQITLELQDSFIACMRESGNPVLINTLDKLLLSINPRSGKADYIVTVAKFITHNATHPQLSLCASEILSSLCRISITTQKEVFSMLTSLCDVQTRKNILHGFVEAIESTQPEIDEESGEEYEPVAVFNSQCRLTILRLLLHCVDQPAPNLTHLLLGFNLAKPINKTSLQDAGVLQSPRTCLHSVLSILSMGMETSRNNVSSQPTAVTESPALAELCYQLIYRLSANIDTTGPVLRYLRSSHDFVYRHLQHLPFKTGGIAKENQLLSQQAWFLKTAAIELCSTSANRQRSHTQRLIQVLFEKNQAVTAGTSILGVSVATGTDGPSVSGLPSFRASILGGNLTADTSVASVMATMNSTALSKSLQPGQEMPQILKILDELDFTQEFPQPLLLDQFVPANVESAIQSCETKNEHGLVYCDIKALHGLLEANVNTLQGTDDADRKARAIQEVQNILKTALERNQTRQSVHSKLALLNAWKHTLEVALNACPSDLMAKETKQQILLDILQELLTRVLHPEAVSELTSPVAAICLTLITHLRTCFSGVGFGDAQRRSELVSDINSSQDLNLSQIIHGEPSTPIPPSLASSLQVIMKGILEWLLQAGIEQKVRANLYASLLYYLQMCHKPKSPDEDKAESSVSAAGLRALSTDIYSKLSRENVRLFRTYGDVLMELVCKDACEGHNVCRILAYSCLDAIVQIDWEQTWLQFMLKKGYVNTMAHSFIQEDEPLQQALTPNPDALRSLYIYEQKMAFLCSLARTPAGSRAVLDSGILNKLSECSFLEMRPVGEDGGGFNSFVPSVMSRYRQLLFPALKVCSSVLATLGGTSHHEASALVLEFMLAHADSIINPVLKNQPVPGDVQSLQEVKFVTGILCQVAGQDFSNESLYSSIPQAVLIELQGHLSRIQRQLLSLLPRYCVSNEWIREIERNNREREGGENIQEIIVLVHEICANLISYCVVIMGQKSRELDIPVLLFAPRLNEITDNESIYRQDYPGSLQQPSLGLLVRLLRVSVSKFSSAMETVSLHKRRMNNIATLTTQELKEITSSEDENLSIPQRQAVAAIKLRNTVGSQEQFLSTLHFIVENTLLLLWQHLDSFILKFTSIDGGSEGILFQTKKSGTQRSSSVRRLQDISNFPDDSMMSPGSSTFSRTGTPLGVGRETISELKRVLPTCMTDVFLAKLCDIEEQWSERSKCTFVRPLVRRIQRIVRLHTS